MKSQFRFLFLLCFCVLSSELIAQDIHFSQFQNHVIGSNAGQTGYMDGDFRINTNHRMQWLAVGPPFLSNTVAFDHIKYWHKERFGWGLVFLNDRSGTTSLLVNQIRPSFAYHKSLGRHVLSAGLQPGWSFKAYDIYDASFPSQFDRNTGGFNNSLPNNEPISALNMNYFDLSAGLVYRFIGENSDFEIGYSSFHVNRPVESFFGNTRLATRHSIQSQLQLFKNKKNQIKFVLMHNQQNEASESLAGVYQFFQAKLESKQSVYFGVVYRDGIVRNSDAMVFSAGIKVGPIQVAYSYDVTISEFRNSNNLRGATEISIIYLQPSSIINRKSIPCERY